MRTVPLTGTKARFARLTMMDGLAERGLTPDAALTAPFTMAVQNGRAVILLDQARVAIVDPAGPHLLVREQYPERFDHALIRAVRNVSELVEEMNKAIKEESGAFSRLITKERATEIRVRMSPADMGKALLGMEAMEPRLSVFQEPQMGYGVRVKVNKTSAGFSLKHRGEEYTLIQDRYSDYQTYFRDGAFQEAVEHGRRLWDERFSDADFMTDLAAVAPAGDVDKFTVNTVFEERLAAGGFAAFPASEEGRFSVTPDFRPDGEFLGSAIRYRGLRLRGDAQDAASVSIFDRLYPEAREHARSSFIALRTRWKARMSGIDLTRTPRLTEDLLTKRIESTDFGYDL